MPSRLRALFWLSVPLLAVAEVIAHATTRSRVPAESDWEAAAQHVRDEWREGDTAVAAPSWGDPLMRRAIGELLSLRDAAPSDLEAHERLWVFSIRGHDAELAPRREPDFSERFGGVWVRRWDLGETTVLYDFVERLGEAEVTWFEGGMERPCPRRQMPPRGGGLGAGPMWPRERFQCDDARQWVFVGATVNEDLSLQPRRCVWQHPSGREPTRATFRDVPLGDRLVFYAGLYSEHERNEEHPPAYATVLVDGEEVGRMIHRDGEGWKRMEVQTRPAADARRDPNRRGTVTVEVTAPEPHLRTFCWAASTHAGQREDAP